jgi:ribose/xylose/arabinose/galactoside ABC-type transport system permease subunit
MIALEDRIQPGGERARGLRDLLVIVLLAGLLGWLIGSMGLDWGALAGVGAEGADGVRVRGAFEDLLKRIADPMASADLLLGLGFLLCLRMGVLDLSIWAVSAGAGLVAAALLRGGLDPAWAFLAATGCGAAVGALQGLLVGALRLPSPAVTLAAAWLIASIVPSWVPGRTVAVPVESVAAAAESFFASLYIRRMLLAAGIYSVVMLGMLLAGPARRAAARHPWRLRAGAMALSGFLAAAGGCAWLFEHLHAPVPTRAVGDGLPVAAAVLSGGLLLSGPGRGLLSAALLPAALLAATVWRERVWMQPRWGWYPQVVLLAVGAAVLSLGIRRLLRCRGRDGRESVCKASAASVE